MKSKKMAGLLLASVLSLPTVNACNSPTKPAVEAAPAAQSFTVRLLDFDNHKPIKGGQVYLNGVLKGSTDAAGNIILQAPLGSWVEVDVRAVGYVGEDAGGYLTGPEVWIFYMSQNGYEDS
jgi:hypothetical protein